MNYKPFVVGAAGAVAADMFAEKLPPNIDVAGLPVRAAVAAFAAVYATHYALSGKPSLMAAAVKAVGSVAGSKLANKFGPAISAGPVNVTSAVGGAVGAWGADKLV